MSIQTFKTDSGHELKLDTSSQSFLLAQKRADDLGLKKDEAFFFARSLEFLRQKAYNPVYATLKLLNGGILPAANTGIPAGATQDTYDSYDHVGQARDTETLAGDIPLVGVNGQQFTSKIISTVLGYEYTLQDMRQDMMQPNSTRSVVDNKNLATRKGIDERLERLLGFGNTNLGVYGFYNNPQITPTLVPNTGSGSSTLWSTKTPANILADITKAIEDMGNDTNGSEVPNRLILDYTSYLKLSNTPLDVTNYSGMSLLKYVEEKLGVTLKVDYVQQLKNAFDNGTKSGFILYNDSADKIEPVIPVRLNVAPPFVKNFTTTIAMEGRCGGVRIFYPKSVSYNIGI